MMLVKILGFGSSWWARFGRDPHDRYRYTRHAAYFNSAGVRCGNKVRRHWILPGLIRFNGIGDFNPQFPSRSVGETFECADRAFVCGGNRLLFVRKAAASVPVDYYLIAVSSDRCGPFNFAESRSESESVMPIAVSSLGDRQEAMLLMKPLAYVRSSLGTWQLKTTVDVPHCPSLELLEEQMLD
ncbi:MAG: hypothetical protein WCA27_05620 [Candidatus Sulfotelmatobacter sp.]